MSVWDDGAVAGLSAGVTVVGLLLGYLLRLLLERRWARESNLLDNSIFNESEEDQAAADEDEAYEQWAKGNNTVMMMSMAPPPTMTNAGHTTAATPTGPLEASAALPKPPGHAGLSPNQHGMVVLSDDNSEEYLKKEAFHCFQTDCGITLRKATGDGRHNMRTTGESGDWLVVGADTASSFGSTVTSSSISSSSIISTIPKAEFMSSFEATGAPFMYFQKGKVRGCRLLQPTTIRVAFRADAGKAGVDPKKPGPPSIKKARSPRGGWGKVAAKIKSKNDIAAKIKRVAEEAFERRTQYQELTGETGQFLVQEGDKQWFVSRHLFYRQYEKTRTKNQLRTVVAGLVAGNISRKPGGLSDFRTGSSIVQPSSFSISRTSPLLQGRTIPHTSPENNISTAQAMQRYGRGATMNSFHAFAKLVPQPEVQLALANFNTWNFDIFGLVEVAPQKTLLHVGVHAFQQHDLVKEFDMQLELLTSFLNALEATYLHTNPYHNAVHAADVCQAANHFMGVLRRNAVMEFTPLEKLATLFACLIHDVAHPGTNNNYQVQTNSALALSYNDVSVLENFHLATAFQMLALPQYNFLENLPRNTFKQFRHLVIQMVMSTDLALHRGFLKDLQDTQARHDGCLPVGGSPGDKHVIEARALVMKLCIQCSDISNPSRPTPLYHKWTDQIMSEFLAQGDSEKAQGLPVANGYDRNNIDRSLLQIQFIKFLVRPLYSLWSGVAGSEVHLDRVEAHDLQWHSELKTRNPSLYALNVAPLPPRSSTPTTKGGSKSGSQDRHRHHRHKRKSVMAVRKQSVHSVGKLPQRKSSTIVQPSSARPNNPSNPQSVASPQNGHRFSIHGIGRRISMTSPKG